MVATVVESIHSMDTQQSDEFSISSSYQQSGVSERSRKHYIGTTIEQLNEELKQVRSILQVYPDEELQSIEQELLHWIDDSHPEYLKEVELLDDEKRSKLRMAEMLYCCYKKSAESHFDSELQLTRNESDYSYLTCSRGCIDTIYEEGVTSNSKSHRFSDSTQNSQTNLMETKDAPAEIHSNSSSVLLSQTETADEDLYSIYSQYKGENKEMLRASSGTEVVKNVAPLTLPPVTNSPLTSPVPTRPNRVPIPPYDPKNPRTFTSSLPFLKPGILELVGSNARKQLFHIHRVEDVDPANIMVRQGQLCYKDVWFKPGDTLVAENRKGVKICGVIQSVTGTEVWLSKPEGASKRIYLNHLRKRKYSILLDQCVGGTTREERTALEKPPIDPVVSSSQPPSVTTQALS